MVQEGLGPNQRTSPIEGESRGIHRGGCCFQLSSARQERMVGDSSIGPVQVREKRKFSNATARR